MIDWNLGKNALKDSDELQKQYLEVRSSNAWFYARYITREDSSGQ